MDLILLHFFTASLLAVAMILYVNQLWWLTNAGSTVGSARCATKRSLRKTFTVTRSIVTENIILHLQVHPLNPPLRNAATGGIVTIAKAEKAKYQWLYTDCRSGIGFVQPVDKDSSGLGPVSFIWKDANRKTTDW